MSGSDIPAEDDPERLRKRLEEAEDTIRAIRLGEVDAFVMLSAEESKVFTVEDAERPYRQFVERMQQAAVTLNRDGSIFYGNRRFAEMVHRTREDLVGTTFQEFVDPSHVPFWDALRREALETGTGQGEFDLRTADGDTIPVYATVGDSSKGSVALSLMLTDLTEQKRHEAVVLSESLSGSILEQSADAVVVCDETGTVIRASQGVAELCGRNPVRVRFDQLFPPGVVEGPHWPSIEAVLQGQTVQNAEVRLRRPDGRTQDLLFRAAPLRQGGRTIGCVLTMTDISARTQVEAALREADRRKDRFLAVLGHELRNAVGPVRNSARILAIIGGDEPPARQAREVIERQVAHMSRLIDDLLDVSRIAEGKIELRKENIDLRALLEAAAEQNAGILQAQGLSLQLRLPEEPLWVSVDATRIAQVLQNLLQNAIKFTDPGGHVTASASKGADGAAVVRIRDTGIGMDEETLERVFDFFSQANLDRSREGLGLGLALSKGLVELHGGQIRADSQGAGRGSEFRIRLPLGSAPEATERIAPEAARVNRHFRILIIEDNPDLAESMKTLLVLIGHDVRTASTGLAGVSVAREFRPEVVLCDIGLPGGMTGHDVARALRRDRATASSYLIAVSGYAADDDQRRALKSGFDLHLSKPIRLDDVERALAELSEKAAVDASPPPSEESMSSKRGRARKRSPQKSPRRPASK